MKTLKYIFAIAGTIALVVILILIHQKSGLSKKTLVTSQEKKSVIEAALTMDLPSTDGEHVGQAKEVSKRASQKVHECNYEEAINITLEGLKKYPKNFTLQSDLAYLLSDCAEVSAPDFMSEDLKNKMMYRSDQLFNKLMGEVDKQPKADVYRFKNEYFYHFRLHREQYELGVQRVADYWGTADWLTSGFGGYYSQGVGAARYAQQLMQKGDRQLALDYAQKAIVAWAQFFGYCNDYYNAYVHYALALGILGYQEEMIRALERSASLIKRDLNYFEFKNVIDFVQGLEVPGINAR